MGVEVDPCLSGFVFYLLVLSHFLSQFPPCLRLLVLCILGTYRFREISIFVGVETYERRTYTLLVPVWASFPHLVPISQQLFVILDGGARPVFHVLLSNDLLIRK